MSNFRDNDVSLGYFGLGVENGKKVYLEAAPTTTLTSGYTLNGDVLNHYFFGKNDELVILTADSTDQSTWLNILNTGVLSTEIYNFPGHEYRQVGLAADILLMLGRSVDNLSYGLNMYDLKNFINLKFYSLPYDQDSFLEACNGGALILNNGNLYHFSAKPPF